MPDFESKNIVYQGTLRASAAFVPGTEAELFPSDPEPGKATRYWTLAQSSADLRDPENSPSVSMWHFLLASEQTRRLNEISIYVEHGTCSEEIRFLYLNDFALTIWKQMEKPIRITGRLERPPRAAVLSFGKPYAKHA